jgi:hypothetical protein
LSFFGGLAGRLSFFKLQTISNLLLRACGLLLTLWLFVGVSTISQEPIQLFNWYQPTTERGHGPDSSCLNKAIKTPGA